MLRKSSKAGLYRMHSAQPNCADLQFIYEGRLRAAFNTGLTDLVLLDTPTYGEVLFMNGEVQSSSSDERLYHEALVRPAFLTARKTTRTLLLGGGEGCAARDMFRWGAGEITQYDYDKTAVTWAREALTHWNGDVYRDHRLTVHYTDAHEAVRAATVKYDVVVVDLFDPTESDISHFVELLCECVRHLGAGGALAAYIGDAPASPSDCVQVEIVRRLCAALPDAYIHPYRVWVPVFAGEACFVLIAPAGEAAPLITFKPTADGPVPVWMDEVNWLRACSWSTGAPALFKELSGKYVQSCMDREAISAESEASN
jgi:predicted membrane-bound spermidine synthase